MARFPETGIAPAGRQTRAERRTAAREAAKHPVKRPDESLPPGRKATPEFVLLPLAVFAAFCALPRIYTHPALLLSFGLTAGVLGVFWLLLRSAVKRGRRELSFHFLPVRAHYVQAVMHASVFAYWGLYWDEVYTHIPLILAQVAFLYAFDMLVAWSRRDRWLFTLGPFPIVFSTNLFLWFKDDWFWLQFLMLATIVICKEFIKWERDGRRTHIFNPSAVSLFIFSAVLLLTNSTGISWGAEIAGTMQRPPQIYLEIFVLGLIVQALFSVTLVTLSSAAVLYIFGLAFTHATGQFYFVDSNLHAAVFLGLHLLVTDPSTSPRRMTGKIVFGGLYGVAVIALYAILGNFGAPQFYDKLLCVPILNLMVRGLDRWSEAFAARFHPLNLLQKFGWRPLNFLHMAIWAGLFGTMTASGFLGRGPALKVECEGNNAASCLAYGRMMTEGKGVPLAPVRGGEALGRSCDLGLAEGCQALSEFASHGGVKQFDDTCGSGEVVACFMSGYVRARGLGVSPDGEKAIPFLEKSCNGGFAPACNVINQMTSPH
ncbi:MAG TPA: hypothetical protein VHC90_10070 [Bryobacteraceae bacterium]|nr:hypothetical protein [Bryobacteraceae bacterium]